MPPVSRKVKPNLPVIRLADAGGVAPAGGPIPLVPPDFRSARGPAGRLQAVLFDLDGVLVDTAEFHYRAWQQLADELGLPFSRQANEAFRGVGRMECLERLLGPHRASFATAEKHLLAARKNSYYLAMVEKLTPGDLFPGVRELTRQLAAAGVSQAVVSASRNARRVIELLGIAEWFDAIVDGNAVTLGKPHPQGFLLAAERVGVDPAACVVVEDAEAGIRAGKAAGMTTIGVGPAGSILEDLADSTVGAVGELTIAALRTVLEPQRRKSA